MTRPLISVLLFCLLVLACGSLLHAGRLARSDSADLLRRVDEVELLKRRSDPYADPDSTYPPTALPVFAALIAPIPPGRLKDCWLLLNLAAVVAISGLALRLWGEGWSAELQALFALIVAASRPVRLGIGLGQFHLIPTALLLLSFVALRSRRGVLAGLLYGLSLSKPTLTLPFAGFLAVRRSWRTLGVALGLQAATLLGVSAWLRVTPLRLVSEWLDRARTQVAAGAIDLPTLVLKAWPDRSSLAMAAGLGFLALGLAAVFAWRRASDLGLIGLCALVSCFFTYHRPYDLVILVPAVAYLFDRARKTREWRLVGPLSLFSALWIAPASERLTGVSESVYSVLFIPTCYFILVLMVFELRNEALGDGTRAVT